MNFNATTVSTVIIAAIALIGVVTALAQWFYRRGGAERSLADSQIAFSKSLDDNTAAHRELTAELRDFKDVTMSRFQNHEVRITVLESTGK